jgi:TatD DNase family protein
VNFVDTHCHIQFSDYSLDPEQVIANAHTAGVTKMIAVGCRLEDSLAGTEFAVSHEKVWASIGLHPHEAHHYIDDGEALEKFALLAERPKVVAIGECGLDYYYNHSPKQAQITLLKFQVELALQHDLPIIFHVRDAFSDFWPIFDSYEGIRGVVHSFSAGEREVKEILERKNLYVGLNGIMTFTKNPDQLNAAKLIPLERMLLETDAPFLTPVPYRGTVCEPKHVRTVATFLADLRGEKLEALALATTKNAQTLFNLV